MNNNTDQNQGSPDFAHSYSLYKYFKRNPAVLGVIISAITAASSFLFDFILSIRTNRYLSFWKMYIYSIKTPANGSSRFLEGFMKTPSVTPCVPAPSKSASVGGVLWHGKMAPVSVIPLLREGRGVFAGIGEAITPIISVYFGEGTQPSAVPGRDCGGNEVEI